MRAFSTLLFAGHAAGLLVKVHRCRWLVVRGAGEEVMAILRDLPVECTWRGGDVGVTGLTPEIVKRVLLQHCEGLSEDRLRVCQCACRCTHKNAVVPRDLSERWEEALAQTPLCGAVKESWRCLGVAVCAVVRGRGAGGAVALHSVREDNWARFRGRALERGKIIWASDNSLARRAAAWNTYGVSLVPSPAQTVGARGRY